MAVVRVALVSLEWVEVIEGGLLRFFLLCFFRLGLRILYVTLNHIALV